MTATIPDDDHVPRYCSPSTVENGKISPNAFYFNGDDYLSVNWLEYLGERDIVSAVGVVREVLNKKLNVKRNGRIAVLNVGAIRKAVSDAIGAVPKIKHIPSDNDKSHAGIFRYDAAETGASQTSTKNDYTDDRPATPEKKAALRIALLVHNNDVYPARKRQCTILP